MLCYMDTVLFGITEVIGLLLCFFAWITIQRGVFSCNIVPKFFLLFHPFLIWRQSIWFLGKNDFNNWASAMGCPCVEAMLCVSIIKWADTHVLVLYVGKFFMVKKHFSSLRLEDRHRVYAFTRGSYVYACE